MTAACLLSLTAGLALGAPVPTLIEVRGRLASIDLEKKELVVEIGLVRRSSFSFTLDADTQVLFGREAGTPSDLSPGQRVRVDYVERDGKAVARAIRVTGARAAPTPGPAPKPDDKAVSGVLRRVAVTDREIVVIGPGAKGAETETTIQVPETAKIVKGGKATALEDLKEGDPARVEVDRRDGKMQATSVQVGPEVARPAAPKSQLIPRLRLALQIVDQILKQLEDR
jgi:hypothetical protein